jgi:hypothetical protein
MFGPKGEELTGFWRLLHNEQIYDTKHHSRDQIKETEMSGACGTYSEYDKCIQGCCRET